MVGSLWILGARWDEMRQASPSCLGELCGLGRHLRVQSLEQTHNSAISKQLLRVLYPRADSIMVLSSQKFSVALCCWHNKVQTLQLEMKSPHLLLPLTNSRFPYSSHRQESPLPPLFMGSSFPSPSPLSWCCWWSLLPCIWLWKSSPSARPRLGLVHLRCFSISLCWEAGFFLSLPSFLLF